MKGRKYIDTPLNNYFADFGFRNGRINFRQMKENHMIENVIYNELLIRGYNVDVGLVIVNQKINWENLSESS